MPSMGPKVPFACTEPFAIAPARPDPFDLETTMTTAPRLVRMIMSNLYRVRHLIMVIPSHLLPHVAVFRVPSMVVGGVVDPSEGYRVSTSVTTMGMPRRFSPATAMSDPVTGAWSGPLKWTFRFRCDPPCRNTKTDLVVRYPGPDRGGGSGQSRIRVAAFDPCCHNIWHWDIVHRCCCCDVVTHNSP